MNEQNRASAHVCWTTTAILAGFARFMQLGTMLGILLGRHDPVDYRIVSTETTK